MKFKQIKLANFLWMSALSIFCLASEAADAKTGGGNVATEANPAFGRIVSAVSIEADANGEIPAGDLVADAQLMATQAANQGRADFALVNPSSLGKAGLTGNRYPFDVRFDQIQSMQSNGTALTTVTLTAQQLKYILEQQFVGCGGQTRQRILQVSNGFSFSWKANRGICAKIWDVNLIHMDFSHSPPIPSGVVDLIITGGVVIYPNKTYRVTINENLAKGAEGFTLLKDGLNPTNGISELDALAAYLENFKFPNPSYEPEAPYLNKPRIVQLPPP